MRVVDLRDRHCHCRANWLCDGPGARCGRKGGGVPWLVAHRERLSAFRGASKAKPKNS